MPADEFDLLKAFITVDAKKAQTSIRSLKREVASLQKQFANAQQQFSQGIGTNIASNFKGAATSVGKMNSGLAQAKSRTIALGRETAKVTKGPAGRRGLSNFRGITLPALFGTFAVADVIKSSTQLATSIEKTRFALGKLTRSKPELEDLFGSLKKLALDTTTDFTELLPSAQKLLGSGFQAQAVPPLLRQLADLSIITSANGVDFSRLVDVVARNNLQFRLLTRDVREFTNAGLNILPSLQRQLGAANFEEVFDAVRKGRVSINNLLQAITDLTSKGGVAFRLQAEAAKTAFLTFDKLREEVNLTKLAFGELIIKDLGVKDAAAVAITALRKLRGEVRLNAEGLPETPQQKELRQSTGLSNAEKVFDLLGSAFKGFQLKAALKFKEIGLFGTGDNAAQAVADALGDVFPAVDANALKKRAKRNADLARKDQIRAELAALKGNPAPLQAAAQRTLVNTLVQPFASFFGNPNVPASTVSGTFDQTFIQPFRSFFGNPNAPTRQDRINALEKELQVLSRLEMLPQTIAGALARRFTPQRSDQGQPFIGNRGTPFEFRGEDLTNAGRQLIAGFADNFSAIGGLLGAAVRREVTGSTKSPLQRFQESGFAGISPQEIIAGGTGGFLIEGAVALGNVIGGFIKTQNKAFAAEALPRTQGRKPSPAELEAQRAARFPIRPENVVIAQQRAIGEFATIAGSFAQDTLKTQKEVEKVKDGIKRLTPVKSRKDLEERKKLEARLPRLEEQVKLSSELAATAANFEIAFKGVTLDMSRAVRDFGTAVDKFVRNPPTPTIEVQGPED